VEDFLARGGSGRRADARRNADRLVAAARAALDEEGLGVTTRQVAQRAGVGLGTLYRQVPNLDELLAAILFDSIAEMTAQATLALECPDPWQGFAGFAETFVQLRAASCGLHDALSADHDPGIDAEVTRLRQAVGELVRHAQRAGALRSDIDWRDVPFVLASAIPTGHTIGIPAREDQWTRNLKIILDGMRAAQESRVTDAGEQPAPPAEKPSSTRKSSVRN
jgi:AcrR family transcriptional regulator